MILTVAGGKVATSAITLTNVADRPLIAAAAAQAAIGTALDKASLAKAAAAAEAIAVARRRRPRLGRYRTKMAGVMTQRALQRAFARATA